MLSACSTNTIETIHFLRLVPLNTLSKKEKKPHSWESKFLHELGRDVVECP